MALGESVIVLVEVGVAHVEEQHHLDLMILWKVVASLCVSHLQEVGFDRLQPLNLR